MLLFRAIAAKPSTGSFRFGGGGETPAERPACHPLVRSLAPALDAAFGLEHASLLPDAIAALAADLDAVPATPTARRFEPA